LRKKIAEFNEQILRQIPASFQLMQGFEGGGDVVLIPRSFGNHVSVDDDLRNVSGYILLLQKLAY
jgi:hypothetical protein